MASAKRVAAYLSILLAIFAACVALQNGRPSEALDKIDAAVPAAVSLLADTDADTDTDHDPGSP